MDGMGVSMEACLMELVAFQSVSLSEDDFHKEGTSLGRKWEGLLEKRKYQQSVQRKGGTARETGHRQDT